MSLWQRLFSQGERNETSPARKAAARETSVIKILSCNNRSSQLYPAQSQSKTGRAGNLLRTEPAAQRLFCETPSTTAKRPVPFSHKTSGCSCFCRVPPIRTRGGDRE